MEVDQKSISYQARRLSPRTRNTTQSKRNSFHNRNIFFGDRPRKETSQLPRKNWKHFLL